MAEQFIYSAFIFIGFVVMISTMAGISVFGDQVGTVPPSCPSWDVSPAGLVFAFPVQATGCAISYFTWLLGVMFGLITVYPAFNLVITGPLLVALLFIVASAIRG